MNLSKKKYKIVKNINQYAGYKIPEKYEPIINEITIDIRIILSIIFNYEELFNNVKAYFLKILKDYKVNSMIVNLIDDINYKIVHDQVRKKEDILPKNKNLLKKLLKIYEKSSKDNIIIINSENIKEIEDDITGLIKIFISLIGFIIDAEYKAKILNTLFINFLKFNISDSGYIKIFFNFDNFYKDFYIKEKVEKQKFFKLLRLFMDNLERCVF